MVGLRRVLIANRGEIAVRVARACREMGISSVVAVTPDERGAMPATTADAAVEVSSYLDAEALVDAARDAEADAVHPGYGFLAEDAAFAELVVAAGLTWIGPPREAMRALGDKVSARAVAGEAGVPVVPGLEVDGIPGDDLLRRAAALGTPLLVKASAGGGGRGMRTVADVGELASVIERASQEAAASFGDGSVYLERRLDRVRHVEVQVLLDDHGNAVHLGERDCSLQRRHQKIVEEAPSPAVGDTLRASLGEAAIAISRRAGYRGAGTVEFLVGDDAGDGSGDGSGDDMVEGGAWWFLEMNARLQVEHPVTEAVTGVDLVRAQLAIAAGARVPVDQADVSLRGHAVEARVYAEDPANMFLPAGGTVRRLELPHWPGVRIDSALREGDEVGTGFDPLLAKVIAWDEDRAAALIRLRSALAEVRIVGVVTNLGFLLDVLARPDVLEGVVDTDWVETRWTPDVPPLPAGVGPAGNPHDPWRAFSPRHEDATGTDDEGRSRDAVTVAGSHAQYRGWAYTLGDDDETVSAEHAAPGGSLLAPMPATVLRVDVAAGDDVAAGAPVAVLEAMKIQVQVRAPAAGAVKAVHVRPGDVVARGQVLAELEEA